jgi:transposase
MRRHELSDEQWAAVEPLIPRSTARTGRPPSDPRLMLNGLFWILATGAPWRDLPERFGPWQTVYDHFRNWRKGGVFAAIIEALQVKLDNNGHIDWELWCVDGANVRAAHAAAGADKKVLPVTPTNRPTTHLAAAAAGLDRSSTWSLTVRATRSSSKSPPDKCTSRRSPSRSSARPSRR